MPEPSSEAPSKTTQTARTERLQRSIRFLGAAIIRLEERVARWSNIRLAIILVGLPLAVIAAFALPGWPAWLVAGLVVLAFASAVVIHRRFQASVDRHHIWREIKRLHLARSQLDWTILPPQRNDLNGLDHFIARDLDLARLHRLIDTCSMEAGSQRLFDWLLAEQPDLTVIRHRQAMVAELRPLQMLRDRLTLAARLGSDEWSKRLDLSRLREWLSNLTPSPLFRVVLVLLLGLSIANLSLFVAASLLGWGPVWLISLALYVTLFFGQWQMIRRLFNEALDLSDLLRVFAAVTELLETRDFSDQPNLQRLLEPIQQDRPSRLLKQVSWIAGGASLQRNPYLWIVINVLVPWDYIFMALLLRLKRQLAGSLPQWMEVWTEVEALSALASVSDNHPEVSVPTVSEESEGLFEAIQIGHPLIEGSHRVCNSIRFEQAGDLVILTGSNMSGKSSFLRTLGSNLALAFAGGPVFAERLQTRPLRLYTAIRITDSLESGMSYFYAEVHRLKGLLDQLQADDAPPLFFLVDEIFRGTNNRERLIGSQAYIQALRGKHGVGIIATHDLELVRLADDDPAIRNMHFTEHIEGDRMAFDYRLRSGPSPTTNALVIMQMAGLPVQIADIEEAT
ncbi:MAG: hypothetical protein GYB68_14690 [Chloroflexi bacterium]|nr:hypothetical protein [Chloroflexota bacterium]